MKLRLELTTAQIEEAIKIYTLNKFKPEGYSISECSFIYDEDQGDTHTPIYGAIVYFTKYNPCPPPLNE